MCKMQINASDATEPYFIRRFAMVVLVAALTFGCDQAPPEKTQGVKPPSVTVAPPLQKRITEWDEFTGRFEAVETVEVRARVSGLLDTVYFKDGQRITEGDLLLLIDPRPFEIALERAKAGVEQARAQLQLAKSDVERAEFLVKKGNIPKRELEARQTRQREAAAILAEAQTRVHEADLNLEWTMIRAPISGRVSDTRVDVGNLITGGQANSTLLTTIVSFDPIHFVVEGSEADYLRYMRLGQAGLRLTARDAQHPVAVRLADEKDFIHQGRMDFVDNALDPNSGTMRARAIFENESWFLTPGVFGRMRLFGGESDAFLIPDSAVSSDQARKIILTVKDDGTVVPKVVTLGPIVDGLRVVRKGLQADDRVIISGLLRARPGQKVTAEVGKIEPRPAPSD